MSTTMVITTVVTADVNGGTDVEKVKQYAFDHVRNHEQALVQELTDKGVEAQVTTALLDVNQLLDYIRRRQDAERRQAQTYPTASAESAAATEVDTDAMSEWEFVEYTLQQLATSAQETTVQFSEEALATMEEEAIGEEFSRYPFLY
ncbi:MAG: hypothetical protein KDE19_18015 [Caldilineaceae bacterium]|nr:hypothetical protein [Caldilineaceae bacterium]